MQTGCGFAFRIKNLPANGKSDGAAIMSKKVFLVGAGTGHAENLTLKAVAILKQADCVLYDALIDSDCLAFAKPGCELIYVGKRKGEHHMKQEEINQALCECTQRHDFVVRLKGGSPTVFGRGYEEVRCLKEIGITCEIVPGVSAINAVPEMFGIPLVDRKNNDSFRVVTGHHKETLSSILTPFHPRENLVILMGAHNTKQIIELLLHENHYPAFLPVSFLCKGGMPDRERIDMTLGEVENQPEHFFESLKFKTPVIIFIGRTAHFSCCP